jgi:hypothetical protein
MLGRLPPLHAPTTSPVPEIIDCVCILAQATGLNILEQSRVPFNKREGFPAAYWSGSPPLTDH